MPSGQTPRDSWRFFRRLWTAGALIAAIGLAALGGWQPAPAQDPADLALELLAERAKLAVSYLQSAQRDDGLFNYEYDFLSGSFSTADSQVRQAATAFAVAEYADVFDDAAAAETARTALRGLVTWSIPFQGGALVSRTGELVEAQIAATSFALLAELMFFSATGDDTFEPDRQAWLRALMQLQRPGGGFWRSPWSEEESDYYNGETWLALAHYHRLFPEEEAAGEALAKAEDYMIERYGEEPGNQFVHWGLMSASVRYSTTPSERLAAFIASLSEAYLHDVHAEFDPDANRCSGVEGLAAAAAALKNVEPYRGLIARNAERAERELANSLELQLLPGQARIELGPDRYLAAPDIANFAGAFLNGRPRPQTRIDSTQHCLSAILKLMAFKRQGE